MAENYKISSPQELLEKVNEELETLEAIFDGEGIVISKVESLVNEVDAVTQSSGKAVEEDESAFFVQCELDLKPNTGFNDAKVGLRVHCRMVFSQFYPFRAPKLSFTLSKGLDKEQFDEILDKIDAE